MPVHDSGREIDEFTVVYPRALAQHLKGCILANRVPLHQDPFGPLDNRAASECALEVLVLREPPQHDVNRALPILDIAIGDLREHTTLGRLLDETRIWLMQEGDYGASRLTNDLVDQLERMLRASAESDKRNVRSFAGSDFPDVLDIDFAGDHLVAKRDHDWNHELKPILALVRDQNT